MATTGRQAGLEAQDSERGQRKGAAEETSREDARSQSPTLPNAASYVPKTRKWALVLVVLGSFAAAAWVAHPLWIPILLGVVMAVSARRLYDALHAKLGQTRASWAAGIITLGSGVLLATIGTLVLFTLTNELMKLVSHLDEHGDHSTLSGLIGERAARAVESLGLDQQRIYAWAKKELEAAASYMATLAAIVIRTTSYALLGLVVSLMTMYYVLLEGTRLARRIERIAPLEPRHTRALILEAREVGRDAFLGTLATACIQGLLGGIGYAALGVPQPVTWALATAITSFLPVIGTLVVWVPMSAWLIVEGHPVKGVFLIVWGVLIITSLADYVIRPRIVGVRGHGHPLLTLIALLGGIEVFGLAGLIVAPIAMSVFVAAFRIYEREVRAGALPAAATPGATSPGVS
ncbi:MAG: AI-2E family transporter [Deltaproteobacteria bacterium]|nr:AI-2E family transporter [Deltaproteobacteria bacterium]